MQEAGDETAWQNTVDLEGKGKEKVTKTGNMESGLSFCKTLIHKGLKLRTDG